MKRFKVTKDIRIGSQSFKEGDEVTGLYLSAMVMNAPDGITPLEDDPDTDEDLTDD